MGRGRGQVRMRVVRGAPGYLLTEESGAGLGRGSVHGQTHRVRLGRTVQLELELELIN